MRIGLDVRCFFEAGRSGVFQYAHNLIRNLFEIDRENDYIFYHREAYPDCDLLEDLKQLNKFHLSTVPAPYLVPLIDRLWQHLHMPKIEMYTGFLDVFHSPNFVAPPQWKGRSVITIHDLAMMINDRWVTPAAQDYFKSHIPPSIERADAIICVSEHTRDDLMRLFRVSESRTAVIYNGVHAEFEPADPAGRDELLKRLGIRDPYVLYVGTIEPRKNLLNLIRAFYFLKKTEDLPHQLVLAGTKGWMFEDIFRWLREHPLGDDLCFTGFVPSEDLPKLYSFAEAFVYPSFYEGFGIPPIEAMACGTPIVSSRVASIPEVVGDAGILVDPENVSELSAAMVEVIRNEGLRDDLIQKGLKRSRDFSWRKTAEQTLALYRDLI